jgi:hypothetical protein
LESRCHLLRKAALERGHKIGQRNFFPLGVTHKKEFDPSSSLQPLSQGTRDLLFSPFTQQVLKYIFQKKAEYIQAQPTPSELLTKFLKIKQKSGFM